MNFVLVVISNVVYLLLYVVQAAMLVRMVLSLFGIESNRLTDFIWGITEPVIYPFRKLFHKMNWFQETPIDMAFLVADIVLLALMFILFR